MASVASTYAQAFADVVLDAHLNEDRVLGELRAIAALLAESVELRRVWENPAVPVEQKRKLLDVIVQRDGISKQVRNLIAVLIDHRRIHFLEQIVRQPEKPLRTTTSLPGAEISAVMSSGPKTLSGPPHDEVEVRKTRQLGGWARVNCENQWITILLKLHIFH